MKIRSVVADLFPAGGRTDRHDETSSPFSRFLKTQTPKRVTVWLHTSAGDCTIQRLEGSVLHTA
jgi:hypothetical protein